MYAWIHAKYVYILRHMVCNISHKLDDDDDGDDDDDTILSDTIMSEVRKFTRKNVCIWHYVIPTSDKKLCETNFTFHLLKCAVNENLNFTACIWTPFQYEYFNSSPPQQNGRLLADDIFRCIFMNEKFCILIKFVPEGPIDNNAALVQIMAWH